MCINLFHLTSHFTHFHPSIINPSIRFHSSLQKYAGRFPREGGIRNRGGEKNKKDILLLYSFLFHFDSFTFVCFPFPATFAFPGFLGLPGKTSHLHQPLPSSPPPLSQSCPCSHHISPPPPPLVDQQIGNLNQHPPPPLPFPLPFIHPFILPPALIQYRTSFLSTCLVHDAMLMTLLSYCISCSL